MGLKPPRKHDEQDYGDSWLVKFHIKSSENLYVQVEDSHSHTFLLIQF